MRRQNEDEPLIAPDYRSLEGEDMAMAVLAVSSGDGKFLTLEHGDYMGAILGLGMKRDKVGDIHVIEGGCHCLVTQDAADYLHLNLSQVHRVHVQTEVLPLDKLELAQVQLDELHLSVASMRMDGIVSDVFRLSRAKVLASDPSWPLPRELEAGRRSEQATERRGYDLLARFWQI